MVGINILESIFSLMYITKSKHLVLTIFLQSYRFSKSDSHLEADDSYVVHQNANVFSANMNSVEQNKKKSSEYKVENQTMTETLISQSIQENSSSSQINTFSKIFLIEEEKINFMKFKKSEALQIQYIETFHFSKNIVDSIDFYASTSYDFSLPKFHDDFKKKMEISLKKQEDKIESPEIQTKREMRKKYGFKFNETKTELLKEIIHQVRKIPQKLDYDDQIVPSYANEKKIMIEKFFNRFEDSKKIRKKTHPYLGLTREEKDLVDKGKEFFEYFYLKDMEIPILEIVGRHSDKFETDSFLFLKSIQKDIDDLFDDPDYFPADLFHINDLQFCSEYESFQKKEELRNSHYDLSKIGMKNETFAKFMNHVFSVENSSMKNIISDNKNHHNDTFTQAEKNEIIQNLVGLRDNLDVCCFFNKKSNFRMNCKSDDNIIVLDSYYISGFQEIYENPFIKYVLHNSELIVQEFKIDIEDFRILFFNTHQKELKEFNQILNEAESLKEEIETECEFDQKIFGNIRINDSLDERERLEKIIYEFVRIFGVACRNDYLIFNKNCGGFDTNYIVSCKQNAKIITSEFLNNQLEFFDDVRNITMSEIVKYFLENFPNEESNGSPDSFSSQDSDLYKFSTIIDHIIDNFANKNSMECENFTDVNESDIYKIKLIKIPQNSNLKSHDQYSKTNFLTQENCSIFKHERLLFFKVLSKLSYFEQTMSKFEKLHQKAKSFIILILLDTMKALASNVKLKGDDCSQSEKLGKIITDTNYKIRIYTDLSENINERIVNLQKEFRYRLRRHLLEISSKIRPFRVKKNPKKVFYIKPYELHFKPFFVPGILYEKYRLGRDTSYGFESNILNLNSLLLRNYYNKIPILKEILSHFSPSHFLDPITKKIIRNPIFYIDKFYDKELLEKISKYESYQKKYNNVLKSKINDIKMDEIDLMNILRWNYDLGIFINFLIKSIEGNDDIAKNLAEKLHKKGFPFL